jgi:hypothetical protein
MNWGRRLGSSMGSSPEPAVPAYRRLRMPRKRPPVLGVDLNRSDSGWGKKVIAFKGKFWVGTSHSGGDTLAVTEHPFLQIIVE